MNLFDPPGTHSGHCAHGANWAPTKTCWQSRVKTICSAQAEAVASRSPGYQAAHRPCIGHAVPKAPFLTSRPLACPFCVRAKSLRFKGTTKEACFSYWVIWIYFENANVKNIQKQCEVPAPWPSSWQQSILTRLFLRRAHTDILPVIMCCADVLICFAWNVSSIFFWSVTFYDVRAVLSQLHQDLGSLLARMPGFYSSQPPNSSELKTIMAVAVRGFGNSAREFLCQGTTSLWLCTGCSAAMVLRPFGSTVLPNQLGNSSGNEPTSWRVGWKYQRSGIAVNALRLKMMQAYQAQVNSIAFETWKPALSPFLQIVVWIFGPHCSSLLALASNALLTLKFQKNGSNSGYSVTCEFTLDKGCLLSADSSRPPLAVPEGGCSHTEPPGLLCKGTSSIHESPIWTSFH